MNCLHSLKRWDHGFEHHSKHGCLCVRLFYVCVVCVQVAAFRRVNHSSKESYRLYKIDYETEEEAMAQQRAVEPLVNEWMESVMNFGIEVWRWRAMERCNLKQGIKQVKLQVCLDYSAIQQNLK
jgi:hypothetical protein